MLRTSWAALALVVAAVAPALAEDNAQNLERPKDARGTTRVLVPTPPDAFTPHAATISPYIYLNRCTGGCQVMHSNLNDARTNQSTIPKMGSSCPGYPTCMLSEFKNVDGLTGANGKCRGGTAAGAACTDATEATACTGGGTCYTADDEWNEVVQCMKEVYSPFAVTVTDQKPTNGVSYTMALIAGKAAEIGWTGALGVAPLAGDCSPQDNVISFSFANDHGPNDRVWNLCWTAAQETAHALGLDHEYQFSDGTSACNDPMTYRFDCGGQKFFRNKAASCGEDAVRPCQCGGSQNSHLKIRGVFGDGMSLIAAPTVAVNSPMNGGTATANQIVAVQAGSKRGVGKVELWLNNYKWAEAPGAAFLANGQKNPSDYILKFPANVPDGIIDIVVKAYDDLGLATASNTVTVTKGAACTSASTCAKGQKCDAGKCFWDAPVGKLGDACDYAQYCESGICLDTSDGGLCSQDCIVGASDGCPADFTCQAVGNGGACVPADDGGGCCSVSKKTAPREMWLHFSLAALILGLVVRRRRKR